METEWSQVQKTGLLCAGCVALHTMRALGTPEVCWGSQEMTQVHSMGSVLESREANTCEM